VPKPFYPRDKDRMIGEREPAPPQPTVPACPRCASPVQIGQMLRHLATCKGPTRKPHPTITRYD